METLNKEQILSIVLDLHEHRMTDYLTPNTREAVYQAMKEYATQMTADRDKRISELEKQLNELDYDLPENMPLYRDSGLWQLRSDDMNEVLLHQFVHEKFIDFINRCKQYNREEILKP